MSKGKRDSWKQLLLQCQREGKDKVLAQIEAYHGIMENMQAALFAEPEMVSRATQMTPILTKQDETILRLRQMTMKDIEESLRTGNVGVHYPKETQ